MRIHSPLCIASFAMFTTHASFSQEISSEEIIVTSTALRETTLQIAQPATVLSGDTLRRQIAGSVAETISSELGVNATYFGPSASRPVIRGLSGDRVLMLHDGVSALDVSSLSQDHAVSIEPVLADQVEILKGPATLLFGSGAVGGVVNVVDGRIPTRFSAAENRTAIEVRGDTAADERTIVGRVELGGDWLRVHMDGFRRDTNDVEIPGYAFSAQERAEHLAEDAGEEFVRDVLENSDSETYGGAFGVSAGDADGFAGLSWARYETNYGVPAAHHDHASEAEAGGELEEDHEAPLRIDMRQDRFDMKAERTLSIAALERVRVRGAYNDYQHRELEGSETGTLFEQEAFDLRLSVDHAPLGGWRGTIGTQYVDIDFAATGEEAFTPPSLTRQLAFFVFEKRDFGDVAVELGARAENQRIDADIDGTDQYESTAYSFSSGAVWNFADEYAAALNLTRSQRHPQSAELYANGAHLAISRFEIGNEELTRETASTIDLTLHRHAETGVHWSIGTFYNQFDDYIFSLDTGLESEELPIFRYEQADAEFYGVEGEITVPLYAREGTRFDIRLASDYVRGRLTRGGDLPQLPPLRYGIELHFERGPIHLGLESYVYEDQEKVSAHERPTEGYTLVEMDASYRLSTHGGAFLLFVRGSNLLDEEARRHTSPLKEIAPLPGRSIHAGIRAEF